MIKDLDKLGHKLIQFYPNYSYRNEWNSEYLSFKCEKCNTAIYYFIYGKYFWFYNDGKEYDINRGKSYTQIFIQNMDEYLKCGEIIIKTLLE